MSYESLYWEDRRTVTRSASLFCLLNLFLFIAASGQEARPYGSEFQVNSFATATQENAALTFGEGGDFMVVWTSDGQDGDSLGVFARPFDLLSPLAAEFQVNSYTASIQSHPAIAAIGAASFVAVWDSPQDGDGLGIFGQRFALDGTPLAGELAVSSFSTGDQNRPAVGADGKGEFVVVWQSAGDQDGDGAGIFGRRYSSDGASLCGEMLINSITTDDQITPRVAVGSGGEFVVVWRIDSDSNPTIQGRTLDADCVPGGEFEVTAGYQPAGPDVATAVDGSFVVVWESSEGGGIRNVFGRRYGSDGAPAGGPFQVNTYTAETQSNPAVAAGAGGRFVVTWDSSLGQDGSLFGVFGQLYASDGAAIGDEFQVNAYTTGYQAIPAVAMDSSGEFTVVWGDSRPNSTINVFGQRFVLTIFADGFESGDTSAWPIVAP